MAADRGGIDETRAGVAGRSEPVRIDSVDETRAGPDEDGVDATRAGSVASTRGAAGPPGGGDSAAELGATRASRDGRVSLARSQERDVAQTRASPRQESLAGASAATRSQLDETLATSRRALDDSGAAVEFERGAMIGRYVVVDTLGRGAMGVVYAAFDPELDRKVAVKLLRADVGGGGSQESRTRLLREAQALAKLSHPNVVGVHDVGLHGDAVWIAMEFVAGRTLTAWLEGQRRGWREVLELMRAVGEGLAAAHAAGLIHRDVKPDNVMVGDDGRVRVMDFGLARADEIEASAEALQHSDSTTMLSVEVTQAGAIVGTPAYMAPEQFLGAEVGSPADVFAYCVTLWEALFGERPFAGDSLAELRRNVFAGRRRAPPRGHGSPRWLLRVLERGLQADPKQRYANLRELVDDLERGEGRARRGGAALAVLGVVVVVVVGFGLREAAHQRTLAACDAAGAAIASDWDAAARDAVERSLLATRRRGAATTFARTAPWLDRWAEAWGAARREACVAHAVEGRWDAALDDEATQCLDELREEFTALVRELREATPVTLVRATEAAAGLPRVEPCLDPTRLRERMTLSADARMGLRATRAKLAQAASLRAMGEFRPALARAREGLAVAEASAQAAAIAEAELRVGAVQTELGEFEEAEASLLRALAAARASRSPRVAVAAMTRLTVVVGARQLRFAEAKVWAEAARTQLAVVDGDDRLAEAAIDNALGLVLWAAGDHEGGTALLRRVVEVWTALLGDEHPQTAQGLDNLALVRWDAGARDEALELARRALAIREVTLGERHPDVAASMSNLGIHLRDVDRYGEARALLERALEIREEALGPEHPDVIASLNNLAGLLTAMNEHSDALAAYERALARLEAAGGVDGEAGSDRKMEATIAYNIGLSHVFLGDEEAARRAFERSLALFEGLYGDANAYVAYPIEGIADTYLGEMRYDEALAHFERALAIRRETQGADHPEYARSLSRIANIQRKRGALEEALALDREALAIYEAKPDPFRIVVLLGLGETLSKLGRDDEAIARLEEALAQTRTSENPLREASVAFALAQALWKRPAARARALALAEAAEGVLIDKGSPDTAAAVVTWLGERRE